MTNNFSKKLVRGVVHGPNFLQNHGFGRSFFSIFCQVYYFGSLGSRILGRRKGRRKPPANIIKMGKKSLKDRLKAQRARLQSFTSGTPTRLFIAFNSQYSFSFVWKGIARLSMVIIARNLLVPGNFQGHTGVESAADIDTVPCIESQSPPHECLF